MTAWTDLTIYFHYRHPVIFPASHFGRGNGSVLLDDVNCLGHENDLSTCQHGGWESSTCSHDDIGIDCGIVYSQNKKIIIIKKKIK